MSGTKIKNMEEFAQITGISRPTVSKYFNDPDSVRVSSREKIEAALEKHDFRPNHYAVNQNRRLTKNIGIVVPYLSDPVFAEYARNIEQRCLDAGFLPLIFSSHGRPAHEIEIFDTLRSLKPAGTLLAPLGRSSDAREVEKFCADVPTVLFDSDMEASNSAFIGSDNFQFVEIMVEYLCRSGEPPVFFEAKTPANPNAHRRRLAYISAMEALRFDPVVISVEGEGWNFEEIGVNGAKRAISSGQIRGGTVLCSNDRLAIGFLAAAYEMGLRVGRDPQSALRVAGLDDHPFSRFACPSLTTVAHDYEAVSQASFSALQEVMDLEQSGAHRVSIRYPGRLLMRESA